MKIADLAKVLEIDVADAQTHLEALGMKNVQESCAVPSNIEAKLRKKLSGKTLGGDKKKDELGIKTELPNGKKVVILFSFKKSYRLALKADVNLTFENHQLILDVENVKADADVFDTIMKVGSPEVRIVSSVPNKRGRERESFEKQIDDWIIPKGLGATGGISFKGSTMLQALFHRDEQADLASEYEEVTPRTLKAIALETKSLINSKY